MLLSGAPLSDLALSDAPQTINIWTNAVSDGDGGNDGNWSLIHVPQPWETAYFTDATEYGSEDDITLSAAVSCYNFTMTALYGGSLDPNGQDITCRNDLSFTLGTHTASDVDLWNGCAVTVGGTFTATGNDTTRLNLRGSAAWTLSVAGAENVSYVNAQYSDASGGIEITAIRSVDLLNNVNWQFITGATLRYDRHQTLRPAELKY